MILQSSATYFKSCVILNGGVVNLAFKNSEFYFFLITILIFQTKRSKRYTEYKKYFKYQFTVLSQYAFRKLLKIVLVTCNRSMNLTIRFCQSRKKNCLFSSVANTPNVSEAKLISIMQAVTIIMGIKRFHFYGFIEQDIVGGCQAGYKRLLSDNIMLENQIFVYKHHLYYKKGSCF